MGRILVRSLEGNMAYRSSKYYGHEAGLSCVFRQPNATHSHCSLLHGYALAFYFEFEAKELDDKNWVVDFGGLKELKTWLQDNFDHTVVLDTADPKIEDMKVLEENGIADLRYFDGVGCEKFAEHAFRKADEIVRRITDNRCYCVKCEVREHGANSGIYLSHK